MTARFATAFEAGLQKIVDGLQKPRAEKRYDKLLERRSPHEVLFGVEMRYTKPPLAVALRT